MRFLMQRLLLFAAALFGISVLVFAMLRILPGDVAVVMAGMNASPARVAALRAEFGLDRPYVVQYLDWAGGLLRGDLGVSALTGRAVTSQVGQRATITFPLIVMSLVIALTLGLSMGAAAVISRSPAVRGFLRVLSIVGGAVPTLWSGLLLILLFARGVGLVGLLPSQGFPAAGWGAPGRAVSSLILPALATGFVSGAGIMRYTRSILEGIADEGGPIDMAMSCGMTRTQALVRVGLRLAAPQLVSVVGLAFASMITGVMVVENLFALPGLGALLVGDVGNRDLVAVQSELFLLAAFFLLIGLAVDLLHALLDPRLAAGKEE